MPSWVPDAIWPSAATKASANTDLTFDHSARYPAASSARPVEAVAELAGPQVVGVGPLEEVHPRGHGAEMPVQDPGVPVHLPHRLRDDHPAVAPARCAGSPHVAQVEPRSEVGKG